MVDGRWSMVETSAHLDDHVISKATVPQCVLSFPLVVHEAAL
ncbi:MAG: hypothetical protein ACI9R8_001531 [Candidatus Paceibacteria bacterium]|jgi:hypothetical protein